MLREIVSAALQVPDSGKLYNTTRRDKYIDDEDASGVDGIVRTR